MKSLDESQLAVGIYPTFSKREAVCTSFLLNGCTEASKVSGLNIGFATGYDARGGGGVAATKELGNGKLHVTFDPERLYIPDVNYKTAKFLGAPMVPPFKIRIEPVQLEVRQWCLQISIHCVQSLFAADTATSQHMLQRMQGYIDKSTGKAELQFIANFMFTAGALYKVSRDSSTWPATIQYFLM